MDAVGAPRTALTPGPGVSVFGATALIDPDGAILPITSPQRRRLLACLAYHVDSTVAIDELLDTVWDGRPPATAKTALHVHVSALRKLLREHFGVPVDQAVRTDAVGYSLRSEHLVVDAYVVADRLVAALESEGRTDSVDDLIARWQRPFQDLDGSVTYLPEQTRLGELFEQARDRRFGDAVAEGRITPTLVADLEARLIDCPLRAEAYRQLATAHAVAGRPHDAAEVCRRALDVGFTLDVCDTTDNAARPSGGVVAARPARGVAALGDLDAPLHRVIVVAAVLGPVVNVSLLRAVLECTDDVTPEVVADGLAAAVDLGLLDRTPVGPSFRDDHVRETLAATCAGSERCSVHDVAARLLERERDGARLPGEHSVAQLAYHAVQALPVGDEGRAVLSLAAAGAAAARSVAWREAATFLRQALDLAVDCGRPAAECVDLQIRLGTALTRAGDLVEARHELESAIERARPLSGVLFAEAVRRALELLPPQALADDPGRRRLLDDALESSVGSVSETRVQLLTDAANSLHLVADLADRAQVSDEALDLARRVGDARTIGLALTGKIGATWAPQTRQWRRAACEDAARWARRAGPSATDTVVVSLTSELATSLECGDRHAFDRLRRHAQELAVTRLAQSPGLAWRLHSWEPIADVLRGDLDTARARSREIAQRFADQGFAVAMTAAAQSTMLALLGGGLASRRAQLEPLVGLHPTAYVGIVALARVHDGDPTGAIELLRSRRDSLVVPSADMSTANNLWFVAETCWATGWDEHAAELAALVGPIAEHHAVLNAYGGGGMYVGCLYESAAKLESLAGRSVAAADAARHAVRAHEAMEAPVFIARSGRLAQRLEHDLVSAS